MSGSRMTLERAIEEADADLLDEAALAAVKSWGELVHLYSEALDEKTYTEVDVGIYMDAATRIEAKLEQSQNHVAQLAAENNRLRAIITELTAERLELARQRSASPQHGEQA